MSIKKKTMIAAAVGCTILTVLIIWAASAFVHSTMFQEYRQKAAIMLHSMKSVRKHVSGTIRPRATELIGPEGFDPKLQSTSYAANGVFARIPEEQKHGLDFKTASIKPRNPDNMATPVEADLIAMLDRMHEAGEDPTWQGMRDIGGTPHYIMAVGEENKPSCMRCHGVPEDAPQAMRDLYPVETDQGYGHLPGRIESAEIVTIPIASIDEQANNVLHIIFLACLAGLLVLLGAVWLGLRTLFRPVEAVTEVAATIADGRLSEAKDALEREDFFQEAGPISRLFIGEKSEVGRLYRSFATMNKNLLSLVSKVQEAGVNISASSAEITAQARQMDTAVTQQAASTNEVAATSKEISATSKELVGTMGAVGDSVTGTAELAETVRQGVSERERTMRKLVETTGNISARLSVINDKALNINSITTTIAKIADQTNLLSLNAAIEAEKAGEFGQGFAVVAREIRRLADQTGTAAEDIELMVKEMHQAVSVGVMEMDAYTQEVRTGVKAVVDISHQIEEIMERVASLKPRFIDTSEGMDAQSLSAEQISEAMAQLAETVHQTSDAIREFRTVTAQLNEAVQDMTDEVSKFKTGKNRKLQEQ